MTNRPACPFRRPDRDDRLRLDRQRHPAADRAAHRLRPREVRGHRPGRQRPAAAGRAQHPLHPCRDHQGELPRGAHPAADRGPGRGMVVNLSVDTSLGRPDGALQGPRRLLHRHRGRALARPLHRPQPLGLGALELCAARGHARAAPAAAGRRHRRELLRRQPGMVSWFVKQALLDIAATPAQGRRSRRPARNGRG